MENSQNDTAANSGISKLVRTAVKMAEMISHDVVALVARLAIASVFWRSMQTKIVNGELFNIQSFFFYQAADDFANVPLLSSDALAYTTVYAETIIPIALVLGFAARASAFAVLGMALTIQLFIYPQAYPDHLMWSAAALLLLARGAGKFSVDEVIARRWLK